MLIYIHPIVTVNTLACKHIFKDKTHTVRGEFSKLFIDKPPPPSILYIVWLMIIMSLDEVENSVTSDKARNK